jgi:predicted porin
MYTRLFILTGALLLASAELAHANNFFIPNHYRNRREPNVFSAIGWSDRREVGGSLAIEKSERDYSNSNTADSKTDSKTFGPYVFYRFPMNLNLEAKYSIENSDKEYANVPSANREAKSGSGMISLGYEFTEIPMALSVRYNRTNNETKASGSTSATKAKDEIVDLGLGYRLENNFYLGAGFEHNEYDYEGASDDRKYNTVVLGGGKVFGNLKSPTATAEGFVSFYNYKNTRYRSLGLDALYNYDVWQYYGRFQYGTSSGDIDVKTWVFVAGVDWQISSFYIGPELSFASSKVDSSEAKFSYFSPSLEAGFRLSQAEIYLRFTPEKDKYEDPSSVGSNYEDTTRTWELGAAYKF